MKNPVDEYMDIVNECYFLDRPQMNDDNWEAALQTIATLYGIICGLRILCPEPPKE